MNRPLVSAQLWEIVEPPLSSELPKPKGGRSRVLDRAVLGGIVFVLESGIPWRMLPKEMGSGSGVTCWRRLRDWQKTSVDSPVPGIAELVSEDRQVGLVEGCSGVDDHPGEKVGPNPTDRGKSGSKRHLVTERNRIPLAMVLTKADVHDSRVFENLLEGIEPLKGARGRPRRRPEKLHTDKGYDARKCREVLKQREIKSRIARKGKESSERLGRHR